MASSNAVAPVAIGGIAVLLAYSAVKGKRPGSIARQLLTGKSPQSAQDMSISIPTGTGADGTFAASASGNAIVDAAMKYEGIPYKWGGAFANGGGGDCSGLVNRVLLHDLHLKGPMGAVAKGESFSDGPHGPVTAQWFATNVCHTVPTDQMQAGDLACWLTHMGIVTGPDEMLNAEHTGTVVQIASVKGFIMGEPLRIRRYGTG
jgi:peptidoglycan DL-endopeptidase CwlO